MEDPDPEPGGPKFYGFYGSGSGTLLAIGKHSDMYRYCTGGARFLGGLYLSPGVEPEQPLPPEGVRALPEELLQKGGRQQQRLPQHQRGGLHTHVLAHQVSYR